MATDQLPAPMAFLAPVEIADCDGLGFPVEGVLLAALLLLAESVPLPVAVALGTSSSVLVRVVWLADAIDVSCDTDEDVIELTTAVSLTTLAAAVRVAGYICASNTMTSAGRSLYHCGVTSPVGRTIPVSVPVGVGIAVFRTERTESLVGSMVAGSRARATRSAIGCGALANALATSMLVKRIDVGFIFAI